MTDNNPRPYNYYGNPIHASRVIRVQGKEAPSFIRRRLQGWGMSEVERLIRELNTFTKHGNAIFELIDECKQDVFGIEGYNSAVLSGEAAAAIESRMQVLAQTKNFHNALILDKEDTFEQKQLTFSGMAEILKEIRISIACAAKMPMTKLFGLSASGFNSGEDDIENYNSMVESEVRAKAKIILAKVLPICFRAKFGYVPDQWLAKFKALRTMTSMDEETVKSQKHARYEADYSKGMLTANEYAEVQRREGLLIMDTEVLKGGEPNPPMNIMMEAPGQGGAESGQEGATEPKAEPKDAPEPKK
jgi:phage-related protein (TIGR01555 family)